MGQEVHTPVAINNIGWTLFSNLSSTHIMSTKAQVKVFKCPYNLMQCVYIHQRDNPWSKSIMQSSKWWKKCLRVYINMKTSNPVSVSNTQKILPGANNTKPTYTAFVKSKIKLAITNIMITLAGSLQNVVKKLPIWIKHHKSYIIKLCRCWWFVLSWTNLDFC